MSHPTLPPDHAARMDRVRLALEGLSVADALGEMCFDPDYLRTFVGRRGIAPPGPWRYTDDTEMALGIAEVLGRHGAVDQDDLARTFARRFRAAPGRGYGPGAYRLLAAVLGGADWRAESRNLFRGMGSFGNGSAMRVAPVGAYFAGDGFEPVAEQARLSAEVTHAHPEGVAGGIAVAVAAAYAWLNRDRAADEAVRRGLFDAVLAHTPPGEVRDWVERASATAPDESPEAAAEVLGDGGQVSCRDTVPYCLWVTARHLGDYPTAVRTAVRVGGDIDTNAAIVGGVVALACGVGGIPPEWRASRESLQFTA